MSAESTVAIYPAVIPASSEPGSTQTSPLVAAGARSGDATPESERSTVVYSQSDEEQPLLGDSSGEPRNPQLSQAAVWRIICVLLIAVFVGNADGSLVLATHSVIASEFHALESSSWLFTAFVLASSATQSSLAKLSDIYGRKPVILVCYALFAVGCTVVGLGQSFGVVILGRVISGSVGGGIAVLVSILITDLVPLRDTAAWRAYVNVAATTGRSLGGPLGGWLADVVGWRWSFAGQAPLLVIAIILCAYQLPANIGLEGKSSPEDDGDPKLSTRSKLGRVDFLGGFVLALLILTFLLPLEIGGVKVPWSHPLIPALFTLSGLLVVVFVVVEKRWAREPIIPLKLFTQKDVVAAFAIMALQGGAQFGLMFCVPIYFQVTQRVSNTEAGAHLFPAVAGNAIGGIISGLLIKKFGRYKWLLYFATLSAAFSYTLLLLRWHGDTNWLEALYIMPGGFGMGVVQSAVFMALQAAVERPQIAPAISTLYLSSSIGAITGLASMSAVLQEGLRRSLVTHLGALDLDPAQQAEIISQAVSNVGYVYKIKGQILEAVVASYIDGLWYTHVVSLVLSLTAFFTTFILTEYQL